MYDHVIVYNVILRGRKKTEFFQSEDPQTFISSFIISPWETPNVSHEITVAPTCTRSTTVIGESEFSMNPSSKLK